MAISCDKSFSYLQLPRGGVCIRKNNVEDPSRPDYLNLQIGSPPETLKDTLNNPRWPLNVPRDFVVPERLIDPRSVVTLAELEFPGYYHFFVRPEKESIRIYLNNPAQEDHLRTMLNEAVFGPRVKLEDFKRDFLNPADAFDISKECQFFNPFQFSDVFELNVKKPSQKKMALSPEYDLLVQYSGGIYHYKLYQKRNASAIFTCTEIDLFSRKKPVIPKKTLDQRPEFAISSIGNSTGFDEKGETSGFVVWVNGQGILIDPPADTRFWLEENHVLPEETDRVILTHCHADHDAGLLQRILENDHLDIYTTATVWNSFQRKYGLLMEELQPTYRWHEIKIGDIITIDGADFRFFYSLHSIPTIAFTIQFKDLKVFYSSDMRLSRSTYDSMFSAGQIDSARFEYFTKKHQERLQWADFVLHEAGGAPLHTGMEDLNTLDVSIKRKTFVYHLSQQEYEEKRRKGINDFTLINTGMDDTSTKLFSKEMKTPSYPNESFLKYCLLFHEMKMRDVKEIQRACEIKTFPRGTVLFRKDRMPDFETTKADGYVYLLYSGIAGVLNGEGKKIKQYNKFDFFGEMAVLQDRPRNADVVALEDVITYAIPNSRFREIMNSYGPLFRQLEVNRQPFIENGLARSFFTLPLSWRARTDLQLLGTLRRYKQGDEIWDRNNERYLWVVSGNVKVRKGDKTWEFPRMLANKLRIDHIGIVNKSEPWGVHSVIVEGDKTLIMEFGKQDYINFCKRHGTFRWRWHYLNTYFPDYLMKEGD